MYFSFFFFFSDSGLEDTKSPSILDAYSEFGFDGKETKTMATTSKPKKVRLPPS